MNNIRFNILKKYINTNYIIYIILLSIYASFACLGENLFFNFTSIETSLKNFGLILLGSIIWIPIIFISIYFLEIINNRISNNNFKIINSNYIQLFFSTFIIWVLYLFLLWPGFITPDSIDQHFQAIGLLPLSNHHNIFHTLFLRVLYNIYDNFTFVIFVQIVLFSVIWAYCIGSFSNKVNIKYLVIFSLLFAAMPNNAQMVISLWKDIPYTFSFLLLTFVVSRSEKTIISSKKFMFLFILAFSLVGLLRHNGLIVVIGTLLIYFIISKNKRKILYLISFIFFNIAFVQYPLMNFYHVIPISNWTKHITMYNDIVGVFVAGGNLSSKTESFLNKEITVNEHKMIYTPYIPALYMYPDVKKNFSYNNLGLNDISTKEIFLMYLDTLKNNTGLMVQNRLLGSDVLWNCGRTKEYNSVALLQSNNLDKKNIKKNQNTIKQVIRNLYYSIKDSIIYANLFNKTGIYLISLFTLFLFALRNFKSKILIIFIPIIFQILSLLLAMQAQDYRYVWPIFVSFWFMLLFFLTKTKNNQ